MVVFWPWWEGGGLTTRWCALFILVPFGLFSLRVHLTAAHWVGAAFLLWATASLLWTPVFAAGATELSKLYVIAGCFLIGADLEDPRPLYLGLALGVAVSGALAIAQVFGWDLIPQLAPPAGLFVNRNYLAEIGIVALILALDCGWYWFLPLLGAAVLLPHSRGTLVAIAAVTFVWLWRESRGFAISSVAVSVLAILALATHPQFRDALVDRTYDPHTQGSSAEMRLEVWRVTAQHLRLFGYGVGGFMIEYPTWLPHPVLIENRPAQAHNEILHEASELGLPGIALLVAFFGLCLGRRLRDWHGEHFALLAVLSVGLFSFPLHIPAVAAVAGLVAGRCARLRAPLRGMLPYRGGALWRRTELAG